MKTFCWIEWHNMERGCKVMHTGSLLWLNSVLLLGHVSKIANILSCSVNEVIVPILTHCCATHRRRNRGGTGGTCPPNISAVCHAHIALSITLCAPPIKNSFLRLCYCNNPFLRVQRTPATNNDWSMWW